MNPYPSMWTGVTAGDGPQQFHLVLLDNGRTDTLADTVGRQALRCIRCSACLNVVVSPVPAARRTARRIRPIGAISSTVTWHNQHQSTSRRVAAIRIEFVRRLREGMQSNQHRMCSSTSYEGCRHQRGHIPERLTMALAGATFAKAGRLRTAQRVGGLLLGGRKRLRLRGPGWIGAWFSARDMVPPARESFRRWWHLPGGARD
jgi:L-lactate dehydrogenase complex protein LldF